MKPPFWRKSVGIIFPLYFSENPLYLYKWSSASKYWPENSEKNHWSKRSACMPLYYALFLFLSLSPGSLLFSFSPFTRCWGDVWRWLCRHMCWTNVDGVPSGGSSVRRPGWEDSHWCDQIFKLHRLCLGGFNNWSICLSVCLSMYVCICISRSLSLMIGQYV
jgi:hypothetical protein